MISLHRLTIFCLFLFFAMGFTYSLTTSKVYSSKSQVAFFRIKIENQDTGTEESRNRWIWIRDGLNIKSALITDSLLENLASSNFEIQKLSSQYPNKQLLFDYLKELINIQFTGADEFNFLIDVHAPSPELAFELNNLIYERVKYFATEEDQNNFKEVITELQKKKNEIKSQPLVLAFYQDKINKMTFNHTVEQKQREKALHIISKPMLNELPIWPNKKLIILVSTFIGLVIGMCLDYLRKSYPREK